MFATQSENDFDTVRRVLDQWMCCGMDWLGICEKSNKITESVAGLNRCYVNCVYDNLCSEEKQIFP